MRGEVGELVVRQPWVGMTRGFWRDPDRYLETYWSRFPASGSMATGRRSTTTVSGSSAAVRMTRLKVAGKRVGPAEVESAATAHPAVQEAAAIGVPHEVKGEAIVVFVVPKPGIEVTDALAEEVRQTIAATTRLRASPGAGALGARPAEDAQREDHAPGDPCGLSRPPRRGFTALENPAAVRR